MEPESEFYHTPVLFRETLEYLRPHGIVIDCTLGGAGHSSGILATGQVDKLLAFDKDYGAIAEGKKRLAAYGEKVFFVHDDFKRSPVYLDDMGIGGIDAAIMDLGVSSRQLDDPERGFAFQHDAPLDMRMNRDDYLTAFNVVNEYNEIELARILYEYGEERHARRIAEKIVRYRQKQSLRTTGQLAEIVASCYSPRERRTGGNPCKKTFQAIRIEVNGELTGLGEAIRALTLRLNKGGRMCVLTFHSLEDRIVKNVFRELEKSCVCPPGQPVCTCGKRREVEILTKKPVTAGEQERNQNPRSRSAKLRAAERI